MNKNEHSGACESAPFSRREKGELATGNLYYVIGPSGAGKDTLIDSLRSQYPHDLIIAHRYITRPANAGGENHVALTAHEFASRRKKGLFALYWQAHGLEYGVGLEVLAWLSKGFSVVVNGSRAELAQAKRCFGAQLIPVVVQVNQTILRQRLLDRGRETEQEIERRLARAAQYALPDSLQLCVIDNSGDIEQSVQQFSLLRAEFESGGVS